LAFVTQGGYVNLNQVTLPVNNMDKSAEFYRDLGFTQIVDTPHYARFECPDGDSTFSLSLEDSNILCGTVIYFEHEQLDDWVNELKVKGFIFDQEPIDQSYLWREAVLHDPSGHKIKLYWAGENRINPPWRVERRT
jgi:catechol 2,3-dioxygenase-like lactoylglutathione lyase family enzyme